MAAGKRKAIKHTVHLRNLVNYLGNAGHSNHVEYALSPLLTNSNLNAGNFVPSALAALDLINHPGKKGRRLETLAHFIIFRFIDGTDLTIDERMFYQSEMVKWGPRSAHVVTNHHHNLETLSTDFNFVLGGWTGDPPLALRSNQDDLLARMRRVSNSLIKTLNIEREKHQRRYIVGVLDVMRAKARRKRQRTIEDDIMEWKKKASVTVSNLTEVLLKFGHRLTNRSLKTGTISVIPRGGKKAIRLNEDELLDAAPSRTLEIIDAQVAELMFDTHRDRAADQTIFQDESDQSPSPPSSKRAR